MVLGEEVASLELELDPFSSAYVGPEEHRRRVEANEYGGRLRKRGNISRNAMVRALPSQVATLYNTLRFVDAVNALLVRRLVPTTEAADGGLSTSYVELMAWGDKALQARFAGATQYLKAAKKFGLLHFRGEVLHEGVAERSNAVHSWSLGCKRQALLDLALLKPQRILPAIARAHPRVRDSVVRFLVFESSYAEQTADFLQGSFEQDLGSLRDAAREAARREEASCAEEAGDHASGARKGAARARIAEIDEAFWPDEDDNEKEEETDARAEGDHASGAPTAGSLRMTRSARSGWCSAPYGCARPRPAAKWSCASRTASLTRPPCGACCTRLTSSKCLSSGEIARPRPSRRRSSSCQRRCTPTRTAHRQPTRRSTAFGQRSRLSQTRSNAQPTPLSTRREDAQPASGRQESRASPSGRADES